MLPNHRAPKVIETSDNILKPLTQMAGILLGEPLSCLLPEVGRDCGAYGLWGQANLDLFLGCVTWGEPLNLS